MKRGEESLEKRWKYFVLLHIMIMLYSMSGIFGKLAAAEQFFSLRFFMYYGMVLFLMMLYAIGWQQIIKRLPLVMAFSNKAVTVVWGIIWGALFFNEAITVGKILGALIVVCGVVLYVKSEGQEIK